MVDIVALSSCGKLVLTSGSLYNTVVADISYGGLVFT